MRKELHLIMNAVWTLPVAIYPFVILACFGCKDPVRIEHAGLTSSASRSIAPLRISCSFPRIELPAVERIALRRLFSLDRGARLSDVLHALRFPESSELAQDRETLLSVVTDINSNEEWFEGKSSFHLTRFGLRAQTSNVSHAQNHDGHLLSILAEIGVPLVASLNHKSRSLSVLDLLNDDIASFSFDREIEWSLLAYALYQVPASGWKNRFDQKFDFDIAAKFLMDKNFEGSSCQGTHALYTLAAIYGIDHQVKLIKPSTRECLAKFLEVVSLRAFATQSENGFWDKNWCVDSPQNSAIGHHQNFTRAKGDEIVANWTRTLGSADSTKIDRVLLTSHHIEWLSLLSVDFEVPPSVFEKGYSFLQMSLASSTKAEVRLAFCPYSHAFRVLSLAAGTKRSTDQF